MKHPALHDGLAPECSLRPPPCAQVVQVDPAIPAYQRGPAVSGNLNSVGSDTMNNLMTYWGEAFAKLYPTVRIQVEGKGSSTAPPALIAGTAQLGPMSRDMKPEEVDAIEKKYGFKPTQIRAALDTIGVYVNKDNPINSLSLPEVDAIFSKTRKAGYPNDITTWGQLGLKGAWAEQAHLDLRPQLGLRHLRLLQGARAGQGRLQGHGQGAARLGLGGAGRERGPLRHRLLGDRLPHLRRARAAARTKVGDAPVEPNYANALSKKYPLSRYLYIYVVRDPRRPMDPLTREFLKFVLSREGQEVVVKDGFLPLPASW